LLYQEKVARVDPNIYKNGFAVLIPGRKMVILEHQMEENRADHRGQSLVRAVK
jgi:hypothetical protein